MSKRERLLGLLGQTGRWDYVPAGFFTHFGPDFREGPEAVRKHVEFFHATGMDFVKIQFEQVFPKFPVQWPEDWANLPQYGVEHFAGQLDVVRGLVRELKAEALVVVTLYSPFMVTNDVGGATRLAQDLDENPEAAIKGIDIMRDNLMLFVRARIEIGVDGFYHSTQGGESRRFQDPCTFARWVKPADLAVMKEIEQNCLFNILHICDYHRDDVGDYDDLTPFLDYPGHLVNCSLRTSGDPPTTTEFAGFFGRPFMGGIDRKGPLATGGVEDARSAARAALAAAPDRFVLAADCTVPGTTPWENLRAAIDEAHRYRA